MNVDEKDRDRTAMQQLAFDASHLIACYSHANEVKDQTFIEQLRWRVMGVWKREGDRVHHHAIFFFSDTDKCEVGTFSQFRYEFYTTSF